MNDLLKVSLSPVGDEQVQTVSARKLHAFLNIRKDFSDWIKAQLADLFTQGIDFEVFPQKGESASRPRIEYALTIECAKHIAMMSRSEQGRRARDYFIECERRAKAVSAGIAIPTTLPEALRLAADLAEQRDEAKRALSIAAPKADALDSISAGKKALTFTQAAKLLGIKREQLIEWLRSNGWIYRQNDAWVAYHEHIRNGRLQFKEARYADGKGGEGHSAYCHILPKGLTIIAEALQREPATV